MPALFVFLFKVNIALLLFCAGYYLVLRHLTFYTLNRVYLVTAIIFSTVYPKIDLTGFAQNHETLTRPVQNVAYIWQAPAQKLSASTDYWQWAEVIFWAGAALLAARLLMQLFSLFKLYRNSKPAHIHNHDVRLMDGDAAPFSFWRSIYVNPANHSPADLQAILLHEQVHVNGWHTIDILLAELSSIFYWFNPGVWLMKKAVRENIEFITDRKILNKGFDSKTYQYSLVNVSFNSTTPGIVNHFNISTIKKRIIMMNAKRSSKVKLTRYAFVVPAVIALLLVFTLSKANVARPLTIKLSNAIKPVTSAIRLTAVRIINEDTIKKVKSVKIKVKPENKVKDTAVADVKFIAVPADNIFIATKRDTAKKATLTIRTTNNFAVNSMDSANFVVNGVKINPSAFKDIDPAKIAAINIISADNLDNILGANRDLKFDNDRKVVFVTTTDSEAGIKLMEKLGTNKQMTNIRITKDGVAQKINGIDIASMGSLNSGIKGKVSDVVVIGQGTYHEGDLKELVINGKPAKVTGGLKERSLSHVVVTGRPALTETISFNKVNTTGLNRVITGNYTFTTSDVNRISDKMIVINGKEASEKELKKISAFDIDRINVRSDADTIKKYGDKAKYGVVYIYTKKNK
jgi:bla regulator protein BlaR1